MYFPALSPITSVVPEGLMRQSINNAFGTDLSERFINAKIRRSDVSLFEDLPPFDISDRLTVDNNIFDEYLQLSTTFPSSILQCDSNTPIINESNTEVCSSPAVIQFDSSTAGRIPIKSHPRPKFRPRTEKESKDSSHFIRCESDAGWAHPTVGILQEWAEHKNLIQVTLVGIDKVDHLYALECKERHSSQLVFKQSEPNSLYFHVTDDDFQKGEKSFLIEYIKGKQDEAITKQVIQERKLHQSMLRFTRYILVAEDLYEPDLNSIEYSTVMTEHYGDFTVEDVIPLYGPMFTSQKVCIGLKGTSVKAKKNDFAVVLTDERNNWTYTMIPKRKDCHLLCTMPIFPRANIARARVKITVEYQTEPIYECYYMYTKTIDDELNELETMATCESSLPCTFNTETSLPGSCSSTANVGHVAKRRRT